MAATACEAGARRVCLNSLAGGPLLGEGAEDLGGRVPASGEVELEAMNCNELQVAGDFAMCRCSGPMIF